MLYLSPCCNPLEGTEEQTGGYNFSIKGKKFQLVKPGAQLSIGYGNKKIVNSNFFNVRKKAKLHQNPSFRHHFLILLLLWLLFTLLVLYKIGAKLNKKQHMGWSNYSAHS